MRRHSSSSTPGGQSGLSAVGGRTKDAMGVEGEGEFCALRGQREIDERCSASSLSIGAMESKTGSTKGYDGMQPVSKTCRTDRKLYPPVMDLLSPSALRTAGLQLRQ